jgi:hypothetical protein
MKLSFNSQGNLYQNVTLTYEELIQHFGSNPKRLQQITNALHFFQVFHRCGCHVVYVDGSFASLKKYPEDIDLCFDLTFTDTEKIEKEFPQFFDPNEIGKIHKTLQCHIFHCDKNYTRLLNLLEEDREGNPKGLVKLNLKDILDYYDKK